MRNPPGGCVMMPMPHTLPRNCLTAEMTVNETVNPSPMPSPSKSEGSGVFLDANASARARIMQFTTIRGMKIPRLL